MPKSRKISICQRYPWAGRQPVSESLRAIINRQLILVINTLILLTCIMLKGLRSIWIIIKEVVLLTLAVLLLMPGAFAQRDIHFTSLTTKEGLSSNSVNAILKDHYGLMWFATDDGLDKFDGTNFTVYRNKQGDTTTLQANEILALHEDRGGNLWVGTSGGSLSLYDRRHDCFINFPSGNQPNAINNNVIRSICSDYRGRIWIANFSGVNILDPAIHQISRLKGSANELFSQTCTCILEDMQHRIWIGTAAGLFVYDPSTRLTKHFLHDVKDPASLGGNNITAITEDSKGAIWIGTEAGLSMLKKNAPVFVNYAHEDANPATIGNNAVRSIACDEAGKLWIGTESGLDIMDAATGIVTRNSFDHRNIQGLTSNSVRSVYIDKEGIYWLGTARGGIDKYDRNLNLFNMVTGNPFDRQGLNTAVVTAFAEAGNGNIYVGTEGGGLGLFDLRTKLFRHIDLRSKRRHAAQGLLVLSLEKTGDNELLIGTFADGLFILNTVTGSYRQLMQGAGGLNANDVFCVKVDHKGNRWLGTNGAGINLLDKHNKIICRYTPAPQEPNDLLLPINGFIRDIIEDSSGMIWIATHGGGMARYNPATKQFTVYTTMNSQLPNDKVQSLLQDARGNIWAGTFGGGLGLFNRNNNQFITYAEKNGLQNNTIYKILQDQCGLIWVSTNSGLSSLDPADGKVSNYNYYNGIQHNNFSRGAGLKSSDGTLFFGGLEGFNYINPAYLKKNTIVPTVVLTDLKISNQLVLPSGKGPLKESISVAGEINLDYRQNFALHFVALNYTMPGKNQYSYRLDGFDKDWNNVGGSTTAAYTNLDPGTYTFYVKASNNDGLWSSGRTSIKIIVHPPVWRTVYAYILYALILIATAFYLRHKSIEKIKRRFLLEQERKEADRIHEIDQLKLKFLTNLSHEFRTPISLILGPADKLLAHEKNIWQQEHLQIIKRNGKRLLNLVNQLLDFRKMEEHELRLQAAEGELISFTRDIFDCFKDLAERKKITFTLSCSIESYYAVFDHDKIERILFNLLSNAFKFTLAGGNISVLIAQCSNIDNNETTWLSFTITDSGIGIPADKKEKIFERFFQNPTVPSILNQGSGIGLSITKEFVNMLGGTIALESECGKGSSFMIQLPFKPMQQTGIENNIVANHDYHHAEKSPLPVKASNPAPAGAAEKTTMPAILLVEDNDDFRFYLRENLRLHYRVYEATNGKEGWQMALAKHPQLIISDISMPYMDGIELCRKLKFDKRTNHIPVILLTALTGDGAQIRGLATGANDYITKPFNAAVLNAKIKNLLILKDTFKNTYSRQIDVLNTSVKVESDDEKLLCCIMRYIDENMTDSQVSVEALSKHVGMSRSTLYSRIIEITGQSPVEYIRSVKLDKAVVLMEKTAMNVSEIAYSVGFATPKYFAKSFRLKFNELPSEYINRIRRHEHKKNGSRA